MMGAMFMIISCGKITTTQSSPASTSTPPLRSQPTTVTATQTITATQTFTPSPVPTATWVMQGPDNVLVPILLYHRIDTSLTDGRYYVTPEKFGEEMKLLHDWKYTTITTEMLIKAITDGIELPPRPILITFDDGHLDNYTSAFPIMQKYGFTGVLYLVHNYIGVDQYMNREQILEMYKAGWEVGSHSMNHFDLTKLSPTARRSEIVDSRKMLEGLLDIPILTFAYPFGAMSNSARNDVKSAGYLAAMGASGYAASQGKWNLFYLQRAEIKGSEDAKTFTRFLPWLGDPALLPTATPSQTPHP